MNRDLALWIGLLAGPLAWLVSFEANFALVPWTCIWQGKLTLYLVSLAAFVISGGAGLLAWRQWGELGREANITVVVPVILFPASQVQTDWPDPRYPVSRVECISPEFFRTRRKI